MLTDKAKELVDSAVSKIKGLFPLSMGKIFSGIQLPHFQISGGSIPWGIGGKGTKPSVDIEWYQKAEEDPYLFTDRTLFGAGEHNDEMLYGRAALMKDIREATSEKPSNNINYYINVNGAESPEAWADRLVRQLEIDMRTA